MLFFDIRNTGVRACVRVCVRVRACACVCKPSRSITTRGVGGDQLFGDGLFTFFRHADVVAGALTRHTGGVKLVLL